MKAMVGLPAALARFDGSHQIVHGSDFVEEFREGASYLVAPVTVAAAD